MPIRPELRHFYRGPHWQEVQRRTLERAGGQFTKKGDRDARGRFAKPGEYKGGARCEHCGRPDRQRVFSWHWKDSKGLHMVWLDEETGALRDQKKAPWSGSLRGLPRKVHVILGCAHLNHVAGDDGPENVKALCGYCHLQHDAGFHKTTRCRRKDRARPLIWEAA